MTNPNGRVLYEGPSLIDGAPIVVIATGFAEAATAVNQAVHWMHPEKKLSPGHSSNLAIFGQKDD